MLRESFFVCLFVGSSDHGSDNNDDDDDNDDSGYRRSNRYIQVGV